MRRRRRTSLWAKIDAAATRNLLPGRQLTPLAAFRDMLVGVTAAAAAEPVSTVLGLLLDRSGYLRDLREERSEEADGRIENLMELVSAAREYESAGGRAGTAVVCRPPGAAVRCGQAGGEPDRAGTADDVAFGQGPRVSGGGHRWPRGGALPAFSREGRRGGDGGGASPLLRGHHARAQRAVPDQRRAPTRVRRVSEYRALPVSRRDSAAAAPARGIAC